MIAITFFITLAAAAQIVVVRQNYQWPHEGDFHVVVHERARIDRIMWCSTIFAPRPGEVPRALHECHADGLLRVKIYDAETRSGGPSFSNYSPTTGLLRISPAAVGGFWQERRPAQILIHGTLADGRRLEQIVRLADSGPLGPESVTEQDESAADGFEEQMGKKKPVPPPAVVEPAQPQKEAPAPIPSQPEIAASLEPVESVAAVKATDSTTVYIVVAVAGFVAALGTITLVVGRRATVESMSNSSNAGYSRGNVEELVEYSIDTLLVPEKEEAPDKDNAAQLRPPTLYMKRDEDLQILTKMGKGANPSFYANWF